VVPAPPAMLQLIWTNLLRGRTRSLLTATGIAIGVASIVALLSLAGGIDRSAAGLINLGKAEMGLFQSGVSELTASTLPDSLAARVKAQPGVADASPIAVLSGQLPQLSSFLVFGVEPRSFIVDRLVLVEGRPPGPNEAMVGDGAARELGLRAGDALALSGRSFRIAAIYHAGVPFEDQGATLPLPVVQRLADSPGNATTIAVSIARGARAAVVAHRLERAFHGTVAISQPGQIARVDTNSLLIRRAVAAMTVLALAIGAFAVMNTTLMAVLERRAEFALLAAVGWTPGRIARLVLGEGLGVSLIGALAGLGLGVLASQFVVRALAASTLVPPVITAWGLARALIVGIAIGVLGGIYPAWRVTRIPVAQTLAR
jgi:putative ABC transport system permease protein